MELRAVLLDTDGTLVGTDGIGWRTVEEEARKLGLLLDDEDIPLVLGRAVEDSAVRRRACLKHYSLRQSRASGVLPLAQAPVKAMPAAYSSVEH